MARPTNTEAQTYVTTLFVKEEWGMEDVVITRVENGMDDEIVDVYFTYGDGEKSGLDGCMSVWFEPNGKLYGEW